LFCLFPLLFSPQRHSRATDGADRREALTGRIAIAILLNLARLRDKFVNLRVSPANDFVPERSVLRMLLEKDKSPLFFELNYYT